MLGWRRRESISMVLELECHRKCNYSTTLVSAYKLFVSNNMPALYLMIHPWYKASLSILNGSLLWLVWRGHYGSWYKAA